MATEHLRERLDRLLTMAETSKDGMLRGKVAFILDIIPPTMPEIQPEILVINKPRIKDLMGRTKPYRKDKCMRELTTYNKREDLFGQICDLIARIASDREVE